MTIGATGTIGSAIVREALDRDHPHHHCGADPAKLTLSHPNVSTATGNVLDPESVAQVA